VPDPIAAREEGHDSSKSILIIQTIFDESSNTMHVILPHELNHSTCIHRFNQVGVEVGCQRAVTGAVCQSWIRPVTAALHASKAFNSALYKLPARRASCDPLTYNQR
jgi:hypothetical protein